MTMEEVIKQFAPGIACFVDTLKKNAKFGITGRSVTIADVTTGSVLKSKRLYLRRRKGYVHGGLV